MKFQTVGNPKNPIALMIHAMFMDNEMFSDVADMLKENYYIVLPVLSGHDLTEHSTFHSAQEEAKHIINFCISNQLYEIEILLGSSLGGLIAFEVFRQNKLLIRNVFLDGTPFINFSKLRIKLMEKVFIYAAHSSDKKTKKNNIFNRFFPEHAARMQIICSNISDESIKNLTRTCYTYSLPNKIELASNQHLTFIYGTAEKAKMCIPTVKAYTNCRLIVKDGYKHCEFLSKEAPAYAKMITEKECLLCPICGNKTRDRIREDTELKNSPLFCPKCKQETLINVQQLNLTIIQESDAQTQSR